MSEVVTVISIQIQVKSRSIYTVKSVASKTRKHVRRHASNLLSSVEFVETSLNQVVMHVINNRLRAIKMELVPLT